MAVPVLRGSQGTVVWFVKFTDQALVEVNLPDALVFGTQRHLITGQRFADDCNHLATASTHLLGAIHNFLVEIQCSKPSVTRFSPP
jgi:hypothetical protein